MRKMMLLSSLLGVLMLAAKLTGQGTSASTAPSQVSDNGNSASQGWVVRDPTTGRFFYQQVVPVTVPTTRWENKTVTTTVQQPQWVSRTVPETQVVYQPQTTMTLEPYWKGRWNLFRQPTLAYRYKPVTNWQPTTVTNQRVVMTQTFVPQQQTIVVPQPVPENRTVQQLVQTEIPQSPAAFPTAIATAPQPRLAYTMAHRPPAYSPAARVPPQWPQQQWPQQTWTQPAAASTAIASNPINEGLRPVTRAMQGIFPSSYQAPLQTASRNSGERDAMQTGMRSTVLR